MPRSPVSIKLIVLDVDGTLTDGSVHYDSAGHEHRTFHIHDGLGIVLAQGVGMKFAVLSGRRSSVVERRMSELGITEIVMGSGDKHAAFLAICERLNVSPDRVAYMGDDINDLPALALCGWACCPADAVGVVVSRADWVSSKPGGRGAVRELIDFMLDKQGLTDNAAALFLARHKAETGSKQ